MPGFVLLSRIFVSPTTVPAAPAHDDDSEYGDFITINAPVSCAAESATVQDDYVQVAATPTEFATSTAATVSTDEVLVEPGQAIVMQKAKSIITMLSGDQPQVKVMNANQCIAFIVKVYVNMCPKPFAIKSHQFHEGVSTLSDCSDFLQGSSDYTKLFSILKNLYCDFQVALCQAISVILNDADWVNAAPDSDLEIPPLILLLKLSPQRLTAGFIEGKVVADILLRADEEWIVANVKDRRYEDKKAEMQLFAYELQGWAEKVLAPRKRLAKASKVRIVGLA